MHVYYKNTIQKAPIFYDSIFDRCTKPTAMICVNTKTVIETIDIANRLLDQYPNIKQVIFDHSQDPIHNKELSTKLDKWATSKGVPNFLVTSAFKKTKSNEIIFPIWFFAFKNQSLPGLTLGTKKYQYSCLNRNPNMHRLLLYTLLKKHNLIKDMIYTFYGKDPYNNNAIFPELLQKDFQHYMHQARLNIEDFPIYWNENDAHGKNDHTISHEAFIHAECNIVTESTVSVEFTSEKLWKPIAAGQFFHVVGSAGTNAWLKTFGFETFDKTYDLTKCSIQRIEQVVNQLSENMFTDENMEKVIHNYHLFHSNAFENTIVDSINTIAQ